jgi:hypothetical protein
MSASTIPFERRLVRQRRIIVFEFVLLLAVGIVVFLVSNNLFVGAVLPSIRAGWRSFRTGLWILQSDHRRSRARICFAFCIATAFWQAAAAALGSVIVFVIVAHFTGNAPNMNRFAATMLQLSSGVALTTVVGLAASIAAATANIRVWVHPMLREIAHDDLTTIVDLPAHRYFNHAVFVLATSLACPVVASCGFLLIDFKSGLFTSVVLTVGPFLACVGYVWLASRIIATHPAECWR